MLWAVSMIGVLCHVLMDLPTSYGTRPLSPFSWTWFAEDWMPIVDIYLLAILGGGLWFGARRAATTRPDAPAPAQCGDRADLDGDELRRPRRRASRSRSVDPPEVFGHRLPRVVRRSRFGPKVGARPLAPVPCGRRRETRRRARCLVEIAAMPDFISPFRWRLIAQLSNGYEVRDLDLLTGRGIPRVDD